MAPRGLANNATNKQGWRTGQQRAPAAKPCLLVALSVCLPFLPTTHHSTSTLVISRPTLLIPHLSLRR